MMAISMGITEQDHNDDTTAVIAQRCSALDCQLINWHDG